MVVDDVVVVVVAVAAAVVDWTAFDIAKWAVVLAS